MIDWTPILTDWSRKILTTELAGHLDPPPSRSDWLGFDPAKPSDIEAIESRIGMALPPSYKSFLLVSNGWRVLTPFIHRLRPATDVEWFHVENEAWIDAYRQSASRQKDEKYYRYSDDGASGHRAGHLKSLLQISDVGDGVYLLNPKAVTPDGEWEAWFFANWVPGAIRYPSFPHLLFNDYRTFHQMMKVEAVPIEFPELATYAPTAPRVPAQKTSKRRPKPMHLEQLIDEMESADPGVRAKAVRVFFGQLKGRFFTKRRPDLAARLTDLFYRSDEADVRGACVAGLAEFAGDSPFARISPLPTVLLDALSDPERDVSTQVLYAIPYFAPDARAIEPLCRFIESGVNLVFNQHAMLQLGEIGDAKAVPTLARILLNTDAENVMGEGLVGGAGYNLGRCGPSGVDVLIEALDHLDPKIRHAAVVGIAVSNDPRADGLLKRMVKDPDPKVRDRAAIGPAPKGPR